VGPIGGGVGYPRAAIISALSEVLSIVPWFSTIFLD